MVNFPGTPVVQTNMQPLASYLCGPHGATPGNRDTLEALDEPSGTRRAKGSLAKSVLHATRKIFHRVWHSDDAAHASRSNIKRGVKKLGDWAKLLQSGT